MLLSRMGLLRESNFRNYWVALLISRLGSQVSALAIPLLAAVTLSASPAQMGILSAMETLPYLLFGLIAGVWVDRLQRRPILIAADVGRAILLSSIPIAALLHHLTIEHLYVVALVNGTLTLFFDISEEAFLPSLVGQTKLVEGYSKLASNASFAETAGPGIGGFIVQLVSAPMALLFDAVSYLASAVLIRSLAVEEPPVTPAGERQAIWTEIREGIRFILRHTYLRSFLGASVTLNLFGGFFQALMIFYYTRDLGLDASVIGVIFVAGGIISLVCAVMAEPIIKRLGLGRTLIMAAFFMGLGWLLIPLASGSMLSIFIVLLLGRVFTGIGNTLYNIAHSTVVQSVTPNHFLGRVNSTDIFISLGMMPISSLIGGILATSIGVQTTLLVAGIGMLTAFLWIVFSPLGRLKDTSVIAEH